MTQSPADNIERKVVIAAVAEDGTIGKDGEIPWHHPEDLQRFKQLTTGSPIIMGDNTYFSLPEHARPLPDRTNIVLTRDDELDVPSEVVVAGSLPEAWSKAAEHSTEEVYIGGGASVYSQTLDQADAMELTRVHETYDGDTYFPEVDWDNWTLESKDEKTELTFLTYTRT
jgi:dihydrofolate reductase (EC 1.5.1.3)